MMNKALERADHCVVRFAELVRLRNADHELTLLRQAIGKMPESVKVWKMLDDYKKELENDLPF